jgi:hypothetical protein
MKKPWIGKTLMAVLTILFIPAFYFLQTWLEAYKNTHYDFTPMFIWYLVWPLLLSVLLQHEHVIRLLSRGRISIRIERLIVTIAIMVILVLGFYPFHYLWRTDMTSIVLILFWSSALQIIETKEMKAPL